jgi:hypothetical protein
MMPHRGYPDNAELVLLERFLRDCRLAIDDAMGLDDTALNSKLAEPVFAQREHLPSMHSFVRGLLYKL